MNLIQRAQTAIKDKVYIPKSSRDKVKLAIENKRLTIKKKNES